MSDHARNAPSVELQVGDTTASRRFTIRVTAREKFKAEEHRRIGEAIAAFGTACRAGMFRRETNEPFGLEVASDSAISDTPVLSWHGQSTGLALSAFKALVGAVSYRAVHDVPIERVEVQQVLGVGDVALPAAVVLGPSNEVEPPIRTGFSVVREEIDRVDKNRRLQIEFAEPPTPPDVDDVARSIEAWDLLCRGGFPEPDNAPWETGIVPGEVYLIDAFTVEHPIDLFSASESAFNAILNYAVTLDERGLRVRQVIIA